MTDAATLDIDPLAKERILLVKAPGNNGDFRAEFSGRFPDYKTSSCDSCLSAIAEVAANAPRAIIVWVDANLPRLPNAVAGLREATGSETALILCCTPDTEAIAQQVVGCGADDYVLYPFEQHELERALGMTVTDEPPALSSPPMTAVEQIAHLESVLSNLSAKPGELLQQVADFVRTSLHCRGVSIIAEGSLATAGDPVNRPVVHEPLTREGKNIGQVHLGDRPGAPYTPNDIELFKHLVCVAGHVLGAASERRRWERLAMIDECSGLPNRRYLNLRLKAILARAAKEHFPASLLLFDIDDFKHHNDTLGHDVGDEIIRGIGRLFQDNCRDHDIVTRFGGDEFAVVFWSPEGARVPGSSHPGCALDILDRFNKTIASPDSHKLLPDGVGRLTISAGLATYPWDGTTPTDLLHRADQALLAAKRAGKNRVFTIGRDEPSGPTSL